MRLWGTVEASREAAPRREGATSGPRRGRTSRRLGGAPRGQALPRGRLLVDAETDAVYLPYRGATFERGSARLISEQPGLAFYLDPDGAVVLLERQRESWSQTYAKRARRDAAR